VAEKINPPNLRKEAVEDEGNVKVLDGFGRRSDGGTFISALDLDDVHNSSNFPYLAGELEGLITPLVAPDDFGTTSSPLGELFQWTWSSENRLDAGEESYVLFITSPAPPTYGRATLKDTYSGRTLTIAVPSPEPASFVLLLMGVAASGVILRRKTK
jgi:hypothetical protein